MSNATISCATCPYWARMVNTEDMGECRATAPQAPQATLLTTSPAARWCSTKASVFCGQHPDLQAQLAARVAVAQATALGEIEPAPLPIPPAPTDGGGTPGGRPGKGGGRRQGSDG